MAMSFDPLYGTGVYNARLPKVDIKLPKVAGGVASPLAFFPSSTGASSGTATDDLETALDTSLQDIIAMGGGSSRSGGVLGNTGSSVGGVSDRSSGTGVETGTTPGGYVRGAGLPGAVASTVGTAISTGLSLAGAPGVVSGVFGKVGKGLLGEGMTDFDMANIAINTAMVALGVPGIAMSALSALDFNPARALAESFDIGSYSNLSDMAKGGWFGGPSMHETITRANAIAEAATPGASSPMGTTPSVGGSYNITNQDGSIAYTSSPTNTGGAWGDYSSPADHGGEFGTTSDADRGSDTQGRAGSGDPGGGGNGSKIVCTAMNEAYGFGGFRNAIWLAYAANNLTPYHEKGYHKIFLPLVAYGFKSGDGWSNKILRNCLEWYARRRSADLRQEMRGKNPRPVFRCVRKLSEYICYLVGRCS